MAKNNKRDKWIVAGNKPLVIDCGHVDGSGTFYDCIVVIHLVIHLLIVLYHGISNDHWVLMDLVLPQC